MVEDETPDNEIADTDTQHAFVELVKTMDWKLWEMLQTMQRMEKSIATIAENSNKSDEKNKQ